VEYSTLKSHPLIGYVLLRYYCGKDHGRYDAATLEHHEKLDGSGYPRKLRKIKKYSQVIGIVDMLDALTSSRPYRKEPYTLRAALDCLLDEAKKGKLNRKIVHLLIAQARKSKPSLKILRVSVEKRDAPPRENMYGKIVPSGSGQGTSLRLATPPWSETTDEYCRNSPGLCRGLGRCKMQKVLRAPKDKGKK